MALNSPRNQPLTMFTAMRALERWLMVAICLAANVGFHGPGSSAAITFSFSVASSRACENDTDSCWFSAP
ncbi:Uncharacterised protein [Acinetobacter baumannii]|nr:Uncharacterised protein [Acinetobacter baumannii]